jgi:vacuolar-type H+-ATPase subunit H
MTETGWTLESWIEHSLALREADARLDAERDRRYSEVKEAEEKALKVKEKADELALNLQRETQTYKDEKANDLRQQIDRTAATFATKDDVAALADRVELAIAPLRDARAQGTGASANRIDTRAVVFALLVIAVSVVAAISPHIR